ncbi:uncharacterized protein LOC143548180 [Bidens hawaiensis]|uniref:uncharacterized protein LOC143548180 n=1 Tax=Bidens hawaiensis TaxID=980011 RepID=UPI00404908A2
MKYKQNNFYAVASIDGTGSKVQVDFKTPMMFTLNEDANLTLVAKIKATRSDMNLGEVSVSIKELITKGKTSQNMSYPVTERYGEPNGELSFSYKFGIKVAERGEFRDDSCGCCGGGGGCSGGGHGDSKGGGKRGERGCFSLCRGDSDSDSDSDSDGDSNSCCDCDCDCGDGCVDCCGCSFGGCGCGGGGCAIDGEYLSDVAAGNLSILFDVGGVVGGILAGHISGRVNALAITAASFMYCAIPALYVYRNYRHMSMTINIMLMLVTGVFVNAPYALITTAVSVDLGTHSSLKGNSRALATVTAIIDGTGSIGAAIGPLLTGYISTQSWSAIFTMLMAAALVALLFLTRLVVTEISAKWQESRESATDFVSIEFAQEHLAYYRCQ